MSVQSILDLFPSFINGPRLIDGGELAVEAGLLFSAKAGIVAGAGGTQPKAVLLSAAYNEVDTVASANDSVMLPLALPGSRVEVNNATATSLQVFGQAINPNTGVGDTIAANNSSTQQATATGVAHAANTSFTYICTTAGQWKQR
jgi:hypothetical protein